MTEVIINGVRTMLPPSPKTIGEHPPLDPQAKALVLFFDTPEQAIAFAEFCALLPTGRTPLDIPEF